MALHGKYLIGSRELRYELTSEFTDELYRWSARIFHGQHLLEEWSGEIRPGEIPHKWHPVILNAYTGFQVSVRMLQKYE